MVPSGSGTLTTEVKAQGDGFMLAFPSARSAILCSVEMMRALRARARSQPTDALRIRIGTSASALLPPSSNPAASEVAVTCRFSVTKVVLGVSHARPTRFHFPWSERCKKFGVISALGEFHITPGQSLYLDNVELGVELGGIEPSYCVSA